MLRLAAYLQFALAIAHLLVLPWLNEAFQIYGIGKLMGHIAAYGAYWPYLITIIIAGCFALGGLYAISACGRIRRLPLLWTGIFFIAFVFIARALMGAYWMYSSHNFDFTSLSSVLIAGFIGLLCLVGGIKQLKPQIRN